MTPRAPSSRQGGSILLLTLLACLAVLGLGLVAMWLSYSSTPTPASVSQTRRKGAMLAAEAGVARARRVLGRARSWTELLRGGSCGLTFGATVRGHVLLCDRGTPLRDMPLVTGASSTRLARWARGLSYTVLVRNDDDEAALQGQRDDDGRLVVLVEGRGVGGLGGPARVALEVVLCRAWLSPVPARSYASEGMGQAGAGSRQ